MQEFKLLSALLCYPEPELLEALPALRQLAGDTEALGDRLDPLLNYLDSHSLIELQENYVSTFDRSPSHSLHLFEHIHGESRDRGQAMVDLLAEYRRHGFDLVTTELPDYVPLFLEFLSALPQDEVQPLLGDAIHVLALLGDKLEANASPYACIFAVIRALCITEPKPFIDPPVRDMDEALEIFGPGADGVEPLLRPAGAQPIQFYPKSSRQGADAPARAC